MNLGPEGRRGEVAGAIPQVQLPSVAWGRRSWGEMSGLQETGANTRRQDRGRVRGEGGGAGANARAGPGPGGRRGGGPDRRGAMGGRRVRRAGDGMDIERGVLLGRLRRINVSVGYVPCFFLRISFSPFLLSKSPHR